MMELRLSLDFACLECEESITAVVVCQGKGLAAGPRTVAACTVPCPHCGCPNEVCFHPTGTVVAVRPGRCAARMAVPSVN
jgi:hypothetical protein